MVKNAAKTIIEARKIEFYKAATKGKGGKGESYDSLYSIDFDKDNSFFGRMERNANLETLNVISLTHFITLRFRLKTHC